MCRAVKTRTPRALSSAGRASALQAEGHRFEPYSAHHILCGLVVQLVRMPACHAGGRRFEPVPGRQFFSQCIKHGGYRQAVKTQGCGSCIRGFESHYPPHYDVGVSPSGKATDSDSVMRRFESCYPSQSNTAFLINQGSCRLKMATQPSGKAEVCKTFIPQFKSGCRLHIKKQKNR